MLQLLTIVLAISFSNAPPQTVGETQGPSVTTSASAIDPPENTAIDPPENTAIDPPENTGG